MTDNSTEVDKTFNQYGISPVFCEALARQGITSPFPIQVQTLPISLAGKDLIGQAKTGTGKTLGFVLPILELLLKKHENEPLKEIKSPLALVVLPTRELAKQVSKELEATRGSFPARIIELYGGKDIKPQLAALRKGVDVVVGTPGRLLDLQGSKALNLANVEILVLDEADEMLDLGFLPDVEKLLTKLPTRRQTMLFSATMPNEVITLAKRYLNHPTRISVRTPNDETVTAENISQFIYRAHALNKIEVLARILQARNRELAIIFTRTKRSADQVTKELNQRGFAVGALHGDLGQGAREQALRAFRNQKIDVLIATDVAARGIDVENVTHVINYQCPDDAKTYIHRIGRTARAGKQGIAITFVDWEELSKWQLIRLGLKMTDRDPVETYHTSSHLYKDLDIPEDAGPRLPRSRRTRPGLSAEKIENVEGRKPRTRNRRTTVKNDSASRRPRKRIRKTQLNRHNK